MSDGGKGSHGIKLRARVYRQQCPPPLLAGRVLVRDNNVGGPDLEAAL